jgi:ADP-ribosylglycohydrolase
MHVLGGHDSSSCKQITRLAARRNADVAVLKQAVHASSLFSHTHELGRDGALVQAAAVAFLSRWGLRLPVAVAWLA